ncbi:hypothetical protein [Nocardia concava]|uniref:hypothetical protein n=1 Tax=Nocardia concava TaxID=257281 RepID=UPI0002F0BD1A|nr:hypothetical protein [Nocardia concava]
MNHDTVQDVRLAGEHRFGDTVLTALGNLIIATVTAVFVAVWWALLFPMISLPIGLAVTAGVVIAWPAGLFIVGLDLAALALWLALWPDSFRRWVIRRAEVRFLRWFRYRRRWVPRMKACGLTDRETDKLYVPRLRAMTIGEGIDRVRVRMLEGQSPEDYHTCAVRLAHTFGAHQCRAIDAGPRHVELVFRHGDSLADPIKLPTDRLRWKDIA